MLSRVALSFALLATASPAVAGGLVYDFTEFWKPRVGITEPRFAPLAYDAAPLIDWGVPQAIRLEYEVDELTIGEDDWSKPEFDPLPYDFDELVSRAPRPRGSGFHRSGCTSVPFGPSEVEGPCRAEARLLGCARRGVSTSLDTNGFCNQLP